MYYAIFCPTLNKDFNNNNNNNTATKHKLLVVKSLSDTRWSARYNAVHVLTLEYNEYIDLLKAISADERDHGEVQNEAKELVKRLTQLETCIFLAVWNTLLERFQQTSSVLQREGIDLNTAVYLLELLQVRGLRERYRAFEEQAKEKKSGKQTYTKTKNNSRKKQRKRFHDESGDEPNALDELPLGESYRIDHFLPIID